MAIWETTLPSTIWHSSFFDGELSATTSKVVKIDNEDSGRILEADDSVVLSFEGVSGKTGGKFLGTVTVDGVEYPVVEADFGFIKSRFIVGLDLDKTTTTKLAETALDTSDFTVCFFPGTLISSNYSGQVMFLFRQFRHEFDYLPVSKHTNRLRVDAEAKAVTPCR